MTISNTLTKQCIHCALVKDVSLFKRKKRIRKKTGETVYDIQNICKLCNGRKYCTRGSYKGFLNTPSGYRSNKLYQTKQEKRSACRVRAICRNKEIVKSFLSKSSCTDCKLTDWRLLEFDHLPQFTKVIDISKMISTGKSARSLVNEIDKCEVVCANCHRLRTYIRSNSWRIL